MKQIERTCNRRSARAGRPTKYTRKVVRVICEAIASGVPYKFAAAIGGISEDTFHEWRRTIPAFSESIEAAVAEGIQARLFLIQAAADKGDVKAAQWWLEHVLPEHFAKSRVEVAHQGSVDHQFSIPKSILDAIARIRTQGDTSNGN